MSIILAAHHCDGRPVSAAQISAWAGPAPEGFRDGLIGTEDFGMCLRSGPGIADQTTVFGQSDRLLIAFDGRIDNQREVAAQVADYPNPSLRDLIAAAWFRWRNACAAKLLGDFSLVIWDKDQRRLYAARDCMGARLLHFAHCGKTLLVATEAAAIAAHPNISDEGSPEALAMWAMGLYDETQTLYKHVACIPPGHYLSYCDGNHEVAPFWDWSAIRGNKFAKLEDYIDHFRELVSRCVADRCKTDAPVVGSMLSGGMDSTTVSAFAAQQAANTGFELVAFSFRFPDLTDCDESAFSRETAAMLGCRTEWIDSQSFWLFKDAFQNPIGRPDPFQCWDLMDHHILDRLRSMGGKVLLTGHGGDSLFTGLGMPTILGARILDGQITALPQLIRALRDLERPVLAGLADYLIGPLLSGKAKHRVKKWTGRMPPLPDWIAPRAKPLFEEIISRANSFPRVFDRPDRQFAWQLMMPVSMGIRRAIHFYNRIAEPYGIEVCHPLYDLRLAEFMLAMPQELVRLDGRRKGFLRRAMRGLLPDPVLDRVEKPDLASFYHLGIRNEEVQIRKLIAESPLVALGLVDREKLGARLEAYLGADPKHSVADFWSVLMTDLWLREHSQRIDFGNKM